MTFGIIAAMTIEMELIRENMEIQKTTQIAGFEFYIGKLYETDIVLTTCNIGKVNAACCTQILIDSYKIDYIINTGIAGGIHSRLKLLDVVIASNVIYYDFKLGELDIICNAKNQFDCSTRLVSLATKTIETIDKPGYSFHVGRIATGDVFISCRDRKREIEKEYAPYCVEMEGAAIGHVATMNRIPFVVIRSISDLADEKAEMVYEELEQKAAENSAQLVMAMIKEEQKNN